MAIYEEAARTANPPLHAPTIQDTLHGVLTDVLGTLDAVMDVMTQVEEAVGMNAPLPQITKEKCQNASAVFPAALEIRTMASILVKRVESLRNRLR